MTQSFLYRIKLALGLIIPVLLISACVQFKELSLYDGVETEAKPLRPERISQAVEPIIFKDDPNDVWGVESTFCQEWNISKDVTHSGDKAIKVSWDRNKKGCKFCGIGIGWDGYAGKDLSQIVDYAAIEFFVRSEAGKMFGLPLVLTLEDYSGGMTFSYTGNKYFERFFIDEDWQKVVVPLNTFDPAGKTFDYTNVKQLQIELQQSGSIYLDDIQLVFFEEEPEQPWLIEETLDDPLAFPKMLFDDTFINNNGWGILKDDCQEIKITQAEKKSGQNAVHATWNSKEGCRNVSFGLSWNKWFPVDISNVLETSAVRFDIKLASDTVKELPVKVSFEDYDRAWSYANLETSYVKGGSYTTEWRQVTVPLSVIQGNANPSKIKQLAFHFEGAGEVFIDNIELINLK